MYSLLTIFPDCTYLKLSVHRNMRPQLRNDGYVWIVVTEADDWWRTMDHRWRTGVNEALCFIHTCPSSMFRRPSSVIRPQSSVVRFSHYHSHLSAFQSCSRSRRFERNENVSSPSTCENQYCGEPPWPRGNVLGLRPPGLKFRILCLEDSVISIISPASGGSPGPV